MTIMYVSSSIGSTVPRHVTPAACSMPSVMRMRLSAVSRRESRQEYTLCQKLQQRQRQSSHRGRGSGVVVRADTDTSAYGSTWNVPKESYLVLGVAHCFEKNDFGKLEDVMVIEPVSANALEGMVAGTKTCFTTVTGLTAGDALQRDKSLLPPEFAAAAFCEDYEFRCEASARTWSRPHAQDNLLDIVPLGSTRSKFNYNLDEKRVLNMENVVKDEDNIKQDMSIDVYGRKDSDSEEDEPATSAPAEEEDDLDALLMG